MKEVKSITVAELGAMAEAMYGNLVKGVVDVANRRLVLDAEMHVDEEQYLLEQGSKQQDLWGFNLHPAHYGTDKFIEFDSMVNIRPRQRNMSRDVEDAEVRAKIVGIVADTVKP